MTAPAERWVVRQEVPHFPRGLGGYLKTWTSERLRWNMLQCDAERFTYDRAKVAAKAHGGRIVRLVSRAEAVARARAATWREAAAMVSEFMDSCLDGEEWKSANALRQAMQTNARVGR